METQTKRYSCNKFEELEKIYTILRNKNPEFKINVEYDDNTKKYTIYQSNDPYEGDPEVPIDVDIKVIYGDSVTGDTPLLLRNPETNDVHIETISSIFDETKKVEYPGFKIFDKSIRLEKEYSTTNYQIWTDMGWVNINRVIRHRCDKKIYRVLTNSGCVDVTEDHSLLSETLEPIKPSELNIGTVLLHSFPTKFDENIKEMENVMTERTLERYLEFNSKLLAHKHYYFYKRLGYSVFLANNDKHLTHFGLYVRQKGYVPGSVYPPESLNMFKNSKDPYSSGQQFTEFTNLFRVVKITELPQNSDYVYDIETDIGRFGVGIGQLISKNTDSCFLRFKYNRENYSKNREDTFRLGTLCGDLFTNKIINRHPIELEFEKIFQPFILLTKKRYIANKYEDIKNPMKLKGNDIKGIALTRRDYCKMVKKCYQGIIDCLLDYTDTNDIENNINKSIELFKDHIKAIHDYKVDIEDLVTSGKLAKTYKNKPTHAFLAAKLKERHEEVQIGDRIPYIFIEDTTGNKLKKTELGEDPKYAKENNLRYNRGAYLEQLAKPILGLYKVILQNDTVLLDGLVDYVNSYLVDIYHCSKLKKSDFTIKD